MSRAILPSQTVSQAPPPPPPSSSLPRSSTMTNKTEPITIFETPTLLTSSHTVSIWRSCMGPALRTALACIIVGVASIHMPKKVLEHMTFPAFSYVTTIMLVGDATLGGALQGTMSTIYGTVLGVLPSMIILYLVKAVGSVVAATTAAVFVMAFVVSWMRPADLIAKRIALGQIVLIFATNFSGYDDMGQGHVRSSIMKPANIAASTVLGVAAALLALVFPYPRLALNEVRLTAQAILIIIAFSSLAS